ncbi:ABC transporter ATP-binding protein/permease [Nocardia sp. NBC_00565]|uniref:ABC transporter ATP-binding protein n=1 Tax=Nocardia sp. NBC_00565 TaxID=2975993 RepID=UPI002E81AA0D|nr:ABC transporter ATP-binding protein [Nocardia sp. NBC_00565]WUC01766.1 ABC transporter ATP-binding protein/permease [Nocardia sp. NBC_00565]
MTTTETPVPADNADDAVADWRGIANEDKEVTETGNLVLAGRSRRLLLSLVRPYRKLAILAMVLIVLDNAAMVSAPLFVAHGLDAGIAEGAKGNWAPLARTVAGYLGAIGLGVLTTFVFLRISGKLSQSVLFDLRARLFAHMQRLSVAFHEKYTSGKVVARLTGDIETLQQLLESALNQALSAILSVLTIAALLIYLDQTLAAIVLVGFVPLALVTRWAQRRQRAGYRRTRGAIAKVVVQFVESMGGMRAVQAFRREARNESVLAAEDAEYFQATTAAMRGMGDYAGLTRLLGNLTTVIVIVVGAWQVIEGNLAVGVLAAYLLYLNEFYGPLDELAQVFNAYQSAAAALEKISGVLEEEPSVPEPEDPIALAKATGAVRMDHMWFGYGADESAGAEKARSDADGGAELSDVAASEGPGVALPALDSVQPRRRVNSGGSARPVLPEFSLEIPAGQVIALVGATGAGKSTLAKLLTRFYDPSGGTVTLDGIDLRRLSDADLRRNVVMVTQESYLFSGSVADNIRLGRPEAGDAEVFAAARAVGLYDFVAALPEGFDTDVRKRGGRLSAGQRQLVAFARVFLADPAVIVLDEATSSLDIPSERLIQRALETVLRDRTAVIIAHRLSTVAIADRVLVLEYGRIVEDGAPSELIAGTGRFASLHAAWRESLV